MSRRPISVVIPARDAAATLARTLAGIEAQDRVDGDEVIVVDNGSRDGTAQVAEQHPCVTRVIRRQRGDGPGAARNAGAAAAHNEALAFLDADCWPDAGWLSAGAGALERDDLVQGRVLPDPDAELGPFDRTLSVGAMHGLFESANLFVVRDRFERAGGFPPGLEGPGEAPFGEDVLFGWQLRRDGASAAFCEHAVAYHAVTARGPGGFVAERLRLAMFPLLAAHVPELRNEFFYRRYFLSRRSASFDLAVAGLLGTALARRPVCAVTVVPYLLTVAASAWHWGPARAPLVAAVEAAGDMVGGGALLRGSVGTGSAVL
jgi:glycosyltransferase involved in cell wall biosynthesis